MRRKLTDKEKIRLYHTRCERIATLIHIHAPAAVIAYSLLPLLHGVYGGPYRALWWHFTHVASGTWYGFAGLAWYLWQKKVRRRSEAEIETMVFGAEEEEEWPEEVNG